MTTSYPTSKPIRLSRRLSWWAGIVIILSVVMAGIFLSVTWHAASEAKKNALIINDLSKLLYAANFLSAERGPSNILMSTDPAEHSEGRLRLNEARNRTDIALQQASSLIPGAQLFLLQQSLIHARRQVDKASVLTKSDPSKIQEAINNMFTVADILHDITMIKAAKWFDNDTSLSTPVLRAIALTELRDTAGRMGSWLIVPVQTHTVLSADNLQGLTRADERIKILWSFLMPSGAFNLNSSNGNNRNISVKARESFFKEGRPMIGKLMSEGLSGAGRYSLSAVELTQNYQTTLSLLERWQYDYMTHILIDYNDRAKKESNLFTFVIITMLLITGLVSGGAFVVQSRILHPLLIARELIVGLADDKEITLQIPKRINELNLLFLSIDILNARLAERRELTRRLKYLAETDELTGLSNRRAFDLSGESWVINTKNDFYIFLIIMDLDHFKSVNDRYGHPTGDQVLISAAAIVHKQVRSGDVAARIGGEEFAVIIEGKNIDEAISLAERIRSGLHQLVVSTSSGDHVKITSSFGIAGSGESKSWSQLIKDADSALYRAKDNGRDCIMVYEK
ncbi:GGDEF domain-containing protein [Erwinia amylovora]